MSKTMQRDPFSHGFEDADWEAAKGEARNVIYSVASQKDLIAYSELVAQVHSVRMEAYDSRLDHFLGQIAEEDDRNGLGLSTVVVVHKRGDRQPCPGFFRMARSQGRDVSDRDACWINELNAVYDRWA